MLNVSVCSSFYCVASLVCGSSATALAQCATCGAQTVAYQPVAVQAFSPVATTTYYSGWYPGYWLGRANRAIWGVPATTTTVGYAPHGNRCSLSAGLYGRLCAGQLLPDLFDLLNLYGELLADLLDVFHLRSRVFDLFDVCRKLRPNLLNVHCGLCRPTCSTCACRRTEVVLRPVCDTCSSCSTAACSSCSTARRARVAPAVQTVALGCSSCGAAPTVTQAVYEQPASSGCSARVEGDSRQPSSYPRLRQAPIQTPRRVPIAPPSRSRRWLQRETLRRNAPSAKARSRNRHRHAVADADIAAAPQKGPGEPDSTNLEAPRLLNTQDRTAHRNAAPVWTAVYSKPASGKTVVQTVSRQQAVDDAAGWVSASK